MKPAKILYFLKGTSPSAEDLKVASELNAQVMFRNAKMVGPEDALEDCDGVAGAVPEIYAKAYPEAKAAIKKKMTAFKELATKVGDEPAPKLEKPQESDELAPKLEPEEAAPKAKEGKVSWNANPA